MKKFFTTVFIFISVLLFKTNMVAAQVNKQDSLALVDFYNSTKGAAWLYNKNWLTSEPVSKWFGIKLSGIRVSSIVLEHNGVKGTLPASLVNLTELIKLDLSSNISFKGNIPSELGALPNLEILDLSDCNLTGTIPASLGNLKKLTELILYGNALTGNIPDELGNLTSLDFLSLSENQLTGTIPENIRKLLQLESIDLSGNQLSGNIPATLCNLLNLQDVDLEYNQLSGSIPLLIGNLTKLRRLNLWNNQLSGHIPAVIGNLINLTNLNLSNNYLSDTIPASMGNLVNMETLDLSFNMLTGSIPVEFGNYTNISELILEGNQLTGSIPQSFTKFHKLYSLELNNNHLNGRIPSFNSDSEERGDMVSFYLESNNFTFAGMTNLVKNFINHILYAPQASILINKINNKLSVYAGGADALSNNTYKWYLNGVLYKKIVGDSTLTITNSGAYNVIVKNSIATALVLYSDTVTVSDANKISASQTETNNLPASLFPNPAKAATTLSFNNDGKYLITVSDATGKIKQTINGVAVKGTNIIQLHLNKLSPGVYFIEINDEKNNKQMFKLIKQ